MTTWPKITIRAIALGNFAVGMFGLYLQIDSVIRFSEPHKFDATRPYETDAYWVVASITFVFVSLALISGFFLWRTSRSALRFCNLLFGALLVYWVGGSMLEVMLATSKSDWAHRFVMSLGSVGGIGNMGIAPQVLTLYPVWAPVVLNLAYWRKEKAETSSRSDTTRTTSAPFHT